MILISGGIGLLVGYLWGFLVAYRANRKYNDNINLDDDRVGPGIPCLDEKTGNVTFLKKR